MPICIHEDNHLSLATLHQYPDIYCRAADIHLDTSNHGEWIIHFLDHAMEHGKVCQIYKICFVDRETEEPFGSQLSRTIGRLTVLSIRGHLEKLGMKIGETRSFPGYTVKALSQDSCTVFSPFSIDKIRPLQRLPARWTILFVKRALANGQYYSLRFMGNKSDRSSLQDWKSCGVRESAEVLRILIESDLRWEVNAEYDSKTVVVRSLKYGCYQLVIDLRSTHLALSDTLSNIALPGGQVLLIPTLSMWNPLTKSTPDMSPGYL